MPSSPEQPRTHAVEAPGAGAPQHVLPVRDDGVAVVPLLDAPQAERIYDPTLLSWALWGALLGAVLLGWLGYATATATLPIAGLGQWAATGAGASAFTGAGVGVALGGLIGALLALRRLPPRHGSH